MDDFAVPFDSSHIPDDVVIGYLLAPSVAPIVSPYMEDSVGYTDDPMEQVAVSITEKDDLPFLQVLRLRWMECHQINVVTYKGIHATSSYADDCLSPGSKCLCDLLAEGFIVER